MKSPGKQYYYKGNLRKAVLESIKQFEESVGYTPLKAVVKDSEYKGEDLSIPVEVARGIQSGHFILTMKLNIKRVPRCFGGKRCPVLR